MEQRLCREDVISASKCAVPTNQGQGLFSYIPLYLVFLCVEGYSCTWSHSVTQKLVRSPLVEESAIAKVHHTTLRGDKYLFPWLGSNTQLQQARTHRELRLFGHRDRQRHNFNRNNWQYTMKASQVRCFPRSPNDGEDYFHSARKVCPYRAHRT